MPQGQIQYIQYIRNAGSAHIALEDWSPACLWEAGLIGRMPGSGLLCNLAAPRCVYGLVLEPA